MNAHKKAAIAGIGLICLSMLAAPLPGEEASPSVTGGVALGIFNRYVFRGYLIGRDNTVVKSALSRRSLPRNSSLFG